MISVPTLEAPGVVLRQLEVGDAAALFPAYAEASERPRATAPHTDVKQTEAHIAAMLERYGAHVWAVTEDGGEALGRIALYVFREGVGEFGVLLRREAQGRGMASKAVELVSAYGFEQLDLHRLMADIDPENSASLTLFIRNGFQREAVLKQNWKTRVGLRDSVIMAKLRG
ncbi:MAG: GNAT family N-acetyltransferase [Hyphomonadaceae bacterium]|nr:GNAT family N-acetyltransferase [Hyphomonadaceae bacterium]